MLNIDIEIFCDGSGLGGYGWIAKSLSGDVLKRFWGKYEGTATNNITEYLAVITALEWACETVIGKVSVFTDSLLVVSQVSGKWQCRKPHLQPLHKQTKELVTRLGAKLAWIPRGKNIEADELSHGWETNLQVD